MSMIPVFLVEDTEATDELVVFRTLVTQDNLDTMFMEIADDRTENVYLMGGKYRWVAKNLVVNTCADLEKVHMVFYDVMEIGSDDRWTPVPRKVQVMMDHEWKLSP